MILRRLNLTDEAEALRAQRELAQDDFLFLLNEFSENDSWASYLERVQRIEMG